MRAVTAVGVIIVLITGALVSGAAAATASSLTRVGGVPSTPAGARVVGSVDSSTTIPVTITLQPPDPAALQSYAAAVSTPGSSDYRHYLSVAAFRARFAPPAAQIAAVRSMLSSDGLTPSQVSANGLVITLSASAAQLSSAFSTSFDQVRLAGGRTAYANTSAPAVPSSIASTIQSVTGLNSLAVAHPLGMRVRRPAHADRVAAERADVATGGPVVCPEGDAQPDSYTAGDLASAYGFSGLYGQNDLGAGQTVGLLELEPYSQADISEYESCYGISPSVTNIPVDGFAETGAGTGEAGNDIEDVIGLAPKASVLVYQALNDDADILADLAQMVSDDQADVLSTSWGMCEADSPPGFVAAENLELEEAAIQGQSFFAASGDGGSTYCRSGELSVADPAGQPFMTAVGGTRLTLGPPPTETTWNDNGHASTGGMSSNATMPAYQLDAAPSVNVIDSDSSGTPCGAPTGEYCREVPDVSASSSRSGGYDFYWNGAWVDGSGTSFAAPLWAAFTALTNGSPACAGTDIGFANPLLYQLAGSDYGKYFNDITTGDNDVDEPNGGLYPASVGYDMATGLGSPIGTALAQGLCDGKQAGITFTNPGEQTGTAGIPADVSLSATDLNGAAITYTVTGLPAGLTVNAATGVISGTPTGAGVSTVTAAAADTDGATATVVFDWNVVSPTLAVATAPAPAPAPTTVPTPPAASIPRAVILKLRITSHTNARITFAAKGGIPRIYQCALAKLPKPRKHHRAVVRPHYTNRCSSPVIYRHLKTARYEFFVRVKGVSGGYSSAATTTFTIVGESPRRRVTRASSEP